MQSTSNQFWRKERVRRHERAYVVCAFVMVWPVHRQGPSARRRIPMKCFCFFFVCQGRATLSRLECFSPDSSTSPMNPPAFQQRQEASTKAPCGSGGGGPEALRACANNPEGSARSRRWRRSRSRRRRRSTQNLLDSQVRPLASESEEFSEWI